MVNAARTSFSKADPLAVVGHRERSTANVASTRSSALRFPALVLLSPPRPIETWELNRDHWGSIGNLFQIDFTLVNSGGLGGGDGKILPYQLLVAVPYGKLLVKALNHT